jgi:hypothetical protein
MLEKEGSGEAATNRGVRKKVMSLHSDKFAAY